MSSSLYITNLSRKVASSFVTSAVSLCLRTTVKASLSAFISYSPIVLATGSRAVMSGDSKSLYNVIFVLGGPGAGKGTQCEKIQKAYEFEHLSAGELLRQERMTEGSEHGEMIAKHLKDGTIVPVKVTCALLKRKMENGTVKNFLIDGFPRNQDNLEGWNEVMKDVADVKKVFFFNCPDQVCVDRCLSRGTTSNRTDDNIESLKKRLVTYRDSTMPIIDHFKSLNLVSDICGSGSADDVFKDVQKILTDLGFKAS